MKISFEYSIYLNVQWYFRLTRIIFLSSYTTLLLYSLDFNNVGKYSRYLPKRALPGVQNDCQSYQCTLIHANQKSAACHENLFYSLFSFDCIFQSRCMSPGTVFVAPNHFLFSLSILLHIAVKCRELVLITCGLL